jgi:DNA-binding IscR family transcriptional regulator
MLTYASIPYIVAERSPRNVTLYIIIKCKEDSLDVLDCVTLRKARNQSKENCTTRYDNVLE